MNWYHKLKRHLSIRYPLQQDATRRILPFWEKGGADFAYYKSAEQEEWMQVFWNEDCLFLPLLQQLDLTRTLEIACGAARHSARLIDRWSSSTSICSRRCCWTTAGRPASR